MTNAMTSNGFKETEIGPIPVDWEIAHLQEAATFTRKPRGLDLSKYDAIPFIPMELVPDDGTQIGQYELRPGESIRSGTYCEKGDILLAKITPSFENGKQGIIGEIPLNFAYATTEVYPIRGKPGHLDQMFLFYFLKLSHVRADIAGKMEGSTGRQRVPRVVIENYPIPLPPLPEQRRIAHLLGTIQRAIAAQDDLIAAAREVKRSLMQRLFTYGPGPEPAPTKETEIGEIPEHWEVVRLGEIGEGGGRREKRTLSTGSLIPFVPMSLLPEDALYVSNWEMRQPSAVRSGVFIQDGDFLLAKITPCLENGKQGIVRGLPGGWGYATTEVIPIRVSEHLDLAYLAFYLKLQGVRQSLASKMEGTTGRQRLPKAVVESLLIPVAPLPEQREIARIVQPVDRKIEVEEQRKAALQALFETMLHQLMTGQIRINAETQRRGGAEKDVDSSAS